MRRQIRTTRPRRRGLAATHERVWPLLGSHVLAALEPDESDDVQRHLAACAACRGEARELGEAAGLLVGEPSGQGPSEDLWDRIAASVREQRGDRG